MKKKIFSIILIVSLLFSIIPMNSYAVQTLTEWDKQTINNSMKKWTIKFNYVVDKNTIKKDNIFVEDSEGNKVETDISLSSDNKKSVIVEPTNPYEEGKTYYLFISNNIKSENKKNLKKGIKMPFILKEEVIIFKDPNLEKAIREEINKPEGDIYKSDVKYIRKIDVPDEHISNLEGIQYLTNLEDLDLASNEISDISLLKGLINLEVLDLRYNRISDISSLSNLINLEDLGLSNNKISDISPLKNLVNLEFLNVSDNEISDINPLKNLVNLEYLYLNDNQIKDYSPVEEYYNKLEDKDFRLNEEESGEIITFKDSNLEELIRNKINKPKGAIYQNDVEDIMKISADGEHISDLEGIQYLTNLEFLYLAKNEISDISLLKDLINLEKLDLGYNEISDISHLSNLIDLEELYLEENKISDINPLKNLVNLEILYLSHNDIEDYSPVEAYYNKLEKKDFRWNEEESGEIITFKDANLEHAIRDAIHKPKGDIYQNEVEEIKYLNLWYKKISSLEGIEYLTNLERLQALGNKIKDITPLKNLNKLEQLELSENNVEDISPLQNLSKLYYLDLDFNQISDIKPLSNLTNLKYLNLRSNQISDITALSSLTDLNRLYLNDNQVKDYSPVEAYYNKLKEKDFKLEADD